MENNSWTADGIVAISGFVVSLVFAYFPGIEAWFNGLDAKKKPLVNLFTIFGIVVIRLALMCKIDTACYESQYQIAFAAFIAALVINQTTFQFGVKQFKK
ncbi:MAG: hypothetical protein WC243_04335 [Patescibacteria group bacterium]|jgi:hypothetical protein